MCSLKRRFGMLKRFGFTKIVLVIGFLPFLLYGDLSNSQITGKAAESSIGVANPAAVYCQDLGYEYEIDKTAAGDVGVCKLPDSSTCDEWDFLSGKCGAEYSVCAQMGYGLIVKQDGNNLYSSEYAVCVTSDGEEIESATSLINLEEKAIKNCNPEPDVVEEVEPEDAEQEVVDEDTLPSSFDWRSRPKGNFMTNVKNQGGCGSCWAFSSVGTQEAALNISNNRVGNNFDLSEQFLNADCFTGNTCCGGWKEDALIYTRDYGIPFEKCFNYADGSSCSCGGGTCDTNCTYRTGGECSDRRCSDRCSKWDKQLVMVSKTAGVPNTRSTIKRRLINKGPLATSIKMSGSFDGSGVYKCAPVTGTNHAVVITGYNNAGNYWIVKNSWGPTWNGDGYFKVGYDECNITTKVYYATQTGFDSTFTTNSKGWAKHVGNWSLVKSDYYKTHGKPGKNSSVSYNGQYYPLTYEVRMKRTGSDTSLSNYLIIRGDATRFITLSKQWKKAYRFQYTNNGSFSVWKNNPDGTFTTLKNWTASSAINKGGWNRLKVIAKGSKLRFYINGTHVWTGTDTSYKSGRAGISMYRDPSSTGDKLLVDWATLTLDTTLPTSDSIPEQGEEAVGYTNSEMSP